MTAISTQGAGLVITTTQASITQALPQGGVVPTATVLVPNATPASPQVAPLIRPGSAQANAVPAVRLDPNFSDNFSCSSEASALLSGGVSLTPSTAFALQWGWSGVSNASFTVSLTETASAQASLDAAVSCNLDQTALLTNPITFDDIVFFVGLVPVDISPSLQFYVSGSAGASGQVTVGLTQSATATAGVDYNSASGFSPVENLTNSFTPSLSVGAGANAVGNARGTA